MPLIEGFPPVVDSRTRILVLGTMPGVASLEAAEYYGHPRNRFWAVMEALAGVPGAAAYPLRVEALLAAGIGLWDTLKRCEREGSLDAAIRRAEPNDFASLLVRHPNVRVLALNGGRAASVFRRRIEQTLPAEVVERITPLALPSTSPANARGGFEALMRRWEALRAWL